MHVYVISVVIYTTVLSQMHKSKSSSIQPQRSGHLKKEIEENEEDEISDLEREPSPIDDSDADGDYVQPSEEEEASDVSDQDPQDDDLQSLLSNKSIPQKQRELMRRLLLERREQVRRKQQKTIAPKVKSPPKKSSDSEDEEPEEAVVRKPVQKKRKLESAQNPASKRAKTQVSFDVEDSDSEIDVEAENRHVHSPSQLPNVATKKRPPKKVLKTKSTSTSKSVSKIKDGQASSSALSPESPERPVDVSTPKDHRQKGASKSPRTPSRAILQSPIRSPHVTPGRVSATKKYAWMPSESESEAEYKDGKKLRKKHANWTEEEKETMYRIAHHFK